MEGLRRLNTTNVSTRCQSQDKTPQITFRGHSRSRISVSPKGWRWTGFYCTLYNNVGF